MGDVRRFYGFKGGVLWAGKSEGRFLFDGEVADILEIALLTMWPDSRCRGQPPPWLNVLEQQPMSLVWARNHLHVMEKTCGRVD